MSEFEIIYKSFMRFMEESKNYALASKELISDYEGVLMANMDNTDIIIDIWGKYGFCSYKKGLFTFINPEEYNQIARDFSEVSDKAKVFARTATGCLFLWEEYSFGKNIAFLNVHTGQKNIISTSFNVLIEWSLATPNFWLKDCYGKTEFDVMEKFENVPHDKCVGYSLALALGGKESIDNMQLFDFKTHLELLSQLHK